MNTNAMTAATRSPRKLKPASSSDSLLQHIFPMLPGAVVWPVCWGVAIRSSLMPPSCALLPSLKTAQPMLAPTKATNTGLGWNR
ncbi:hypothetical protein ZWY2020_043073 [Hordeum vulgare]|nr:hypothetical protein ZWY2020_043073 [Hordeum vulgare]